MADDNIAYDESYTERKAAIANYPSVFPFGGKDDRVEIECVPAHHFTALLQENDEGKWEGILAMGLRGVGGLCTRHTADDLREMGQGLINMANHMDKVNK